MPERIRVVEQNHYHVVGNLASFVVRAASPELALLKTQYFCEEEIWSFKGNLPLIALIDDFSVEPVDEDETTAREIVYSRTGQSSITLQDVDLQTLQDPGILAELSSNAILSDTEDLPELIVA